MKLCAIIPSHNHYQHTGDIVATLCRHGVPVIIIDDGSSDPARTILAKLHNKEQGCSVYRTPKNSGKGAAVIRGMRIAMTAGYTHALQVDADGQHDLSDLQSFIDLAQKHPKATICGAPDYDRSVPLGRKFGRWITHVWVWIETLSFRITDSMCGFRIYPLGAVRPLLNADTIGQHMDFDTDIIVRLFWRGVPPLMYPIKVIYPKENSSNFDMLKDNWRITKMHTRLFLTMLARLPKIISSRPPRLDEGTRWAALSERGIYFGLKFCAITCRLLGRGGQRFILAPIVLYFYATGSVQRRASVQFLTRALGRAPTRVEVYKNFLNFAMRAVDVFLAWIGHLPKEILQLSDRAIINKAIADERGGLLVVPHFGNVEVVRALIDKEMLHRITVLVHTQHAVKYNRIIEEASADASMNMMEVTEVGPETIIALKERVELGGWVVIAGDRVPVKGDKNTVSTPFFGHDAPFPQGPWILASLLGCPVYLLFSYLRQGRYCVTMEYVAEKVILPRGERDETIRKYVNLYAQRLEVYCRKAPDQWYNFFNFWSQ